MNSYFYPVPSFSGLPKAAVVSALQAARSYVKNAGHSVCGALTTANIGEEIRNEVKGRISASLDGEPWVTWTDQYKRYLGDRKATWKAATEYRLRWIDEMIKDLQS